MTKEQKKLLREHITEQIQSFDYSNLDVFMEENEIEDFDEVSEYWRALHEK